MSEQGTQAEPSMEEILASIRRIISEDGEDEGADSAAALEAEAPEAVEAAGEPDPAEEEATPIEDLMVGDDEAADEDDVLELTDIAEVEPVPEPEPEIAAAPEPEPEPEPEPVADDPFDTGEDSDLMAIDRTPEPEPAPEPAPAPVVAPIPVANTAPTPEPTSLMSEEATAAASAAFDRLSDDMRISGEGESGTLEGLVQDLLRPMMKAWLDNNLPAIVEAAVAEEVERVARRRRR
jgi:cell pole-organizing protein PopZ